MTGVLNVLNPISAVLNHVTTAPVHPIYFPYIIAPTLHATRISIVFQSLASPPKNGATIPVRPSWPAYIIGYLIMCWGGTLVSHQLLNLTPPMLYSHHPYINYIVPHLVLSSLFYCFPALLHGYPRALSTLLVPVDAILRTNAVISTLTLLESNATINPLVRTSPTAHVILGAIASAGGSTIAGTFSTWSPNWSMNTPPFLRGGSGVWGTLDVWGGSLAAVLYSCLTHHPAFSHFLKESAFSSFAPSAMPHSMSRSMICLVFGSLFALRVWRTQWASPRSGTTAFTVDKGKKKTQ